MIKKLKKGILSFLILSALVLTSFAINQDKAYAGTMQDNWSYNDYVGYSYVQSGGYVYAVQQMLYSSGLGYYVGVVDGYWGPNTYDAVKRFQSMTGLYPDGIVGPATWAKFQQYRIYSSPYYLYQYSPSITQTTYNRYDWNNWWVYLPDGRWVKVYY